MLDNISPKLPLKVFVVFTCILLSSIFAGIYKENFLYLSIPFILIGTYLVLVDFKKIYFLLLLILPLSTEYSFPNGFSTDLPSEPLMIVLMFTYFFYVVLNPTQLKKQFLLHPIIVMLLIHFAWIIISVIYSTGFFISFKYLLAKTWYIIVFVFLTGIILKDLKSLKIAFWCMFLPLLFTVVQTLIRHGIQHHFDFEEINHSLIPFFRNHVNYAAMITLFFPYIWYARKFYKKGTFIRRVLIFSCLIFLAGIIFAYTRTAWLAILLLPLVYFIIKKRLLKYCVGVGLVFGILGIAYLVHHNNYLKFAPNFEKTIYHGNLNDHLEATYQMEDVSSAERLYRWIAAARMSADRPITGYGPNNFFNNYKKYTVNSFVTYVSDNPEKSGVHNYFLMIMVEQGYIGLGIFLLFSIIILLSGERIYHQARGELRKGLAMSIILSLVAIFVNLTLGDLIEVDKVGSIFFINITLLVLIDNQIKKKEKDLRLRLDY